MGLADLGDHYHVRLLGTPFITSDYVIIHTLLQVDDAAACAEPLAVCSSFMFLCP